jgi:hypothetical protein
MTAIHFKIQIEQDKAIPLPEGVVIPPGPAEVIVIPQAAASTEPDAGESRVPQIALDLARFAEENGPTGLPADYAFNHDHYLHGTPQWIDRQ